MITIVKGTLFVDLDGTVLNSVNEEPLPCAVEKINKAFDDGYMIVITTYRGDNYPTVNPYSRLSTSRTLKAIGLKYHHIIWNSPSPRILINDDVCGAIQHKPNTGWEEYEF